MANGEFDWIRHALTVAREAGCSEVELEYDDVEFEAVLEPAKSKPSASREATPVAAPLMTKSVSAPCVGYLRLDKPLVVGQQIKEGDIVASIEALGHKNEVESKVSGEVIEVLVEANQAVEFGQSLVVVK